MKHTSDTCRCRVVGRPAGLIRVKSVPRGRKDIMVCGDTHGEIARSVTVVIQSLQSQSQRDAYPPPANLCATVASTWIRCGAASLNVRGLNAWKNLTAFVFMFLDDARRGDRLDRAIHTTNGEWHMFSEFVDVSALDRQANESSHGWYTRRRNKFKRSILAVAERAGALAVTRCEGG